MCQLDEVYNNDAHIKYIAHKLLSVVLDVEIVHGWITAAMTPVVTTVKRAAWQWASIDNVARVFYNDISHTNDTATILHVFSCLDTLHK